MSRVIDDPRVYLKEALALSDQLIEKPRDERTALKLAVKVQALNEVLKHGAFKLVRR